MALSVIVLYPDQVLRLLNYVVKDQKSLLLHSANCLFGGRIRGVGRRRQAL
jgi:hypothetical protein